MSVVALTAFVSCDDKPVTPDKLPSKAKTFLNTYFPGVAVLSVTNSGSEIPQEKQDLLFERFYRMDEARTGEGDHYGLGLAIAKAITQAHGGTIGIACKDGKVTFTAVLPIKK